MFSASLRATLEAAGFRAECFTSGTNALTELRTRAFAMAILGLDLRDTDPYAICREMSHHVPIITVELPAGASRMSEDELWSRYGPMLIAAIEFDAHR